MPSLEKYVQKIHKKLNNERLEEAKVREQCGGFMYCGDLHKAFFIAPFMKYVD